MQLIDYLVYGSLALTVIFGLGLVLERLAEIYVERQTRKHEESNRPY